MNYCSVKESKIYINYSYQNLQEMLSGKESKVVIITDTNLHKLYSGFLNNYEVIVIGTGETEKTFATIQNIHDRFLEIGIDRHSFVIGFGGGIVCDIAGFAASIYMRGIPFGFIATSLLAMVDAAIGGKNGVNLHGFKNIIGTITQPRFVICDPQLLNTLPDNEIKNGLSEVVKSALIADADLFEMIESNLSGFLKRDCNLLSNIITGAVKVKSDIVNEDEKENGIRKVLNFGHTFGHAIEKSSIISHGQAVSIGMVMAAKISEKKGMIYKNDVERIITLLNGIGLPVHTEIPVSQLLFAIQKDKKKQNTTVDFILLQGIGKCQISKLSFSEIEEMLYE